MLTSQSQKMRSKVGEQVLKISSEREKRERLDKTLVVHLPEYSRVRLQNLIKDGFVKVDGETITKPSTILDRLQEIEIIIPEVQSTDLLAEKIPLSILYEDQNLLVINKPAGMVVHPAAGHASGTLVNAVLGYAPDLKGIGGEMRPGIVHRLDKETSGIILVAKNEQSHRWLQDQFRLRKVEKTYLALVDGKPPTSSGRVEAAIGRDTTHRKKMAVTQPGKGREAVSEYQVIKEFQNHSLIEFHPLTGRTHQIRLHCALLGCPIVGDRVYGRKNPSLAIDRHFLHAYRLKIILPGEKSPHLFEAPLPERLVELLEQLKFTEGINTE